MLKRLLFFCFGLGLSIIFISSLGESNRFKETLIAYYNYFDMNKRVISHLISDNTRFTSQAMCQLEYYSMSKNELLEVLNEGKVNFDRSDKNKTPCQFFVIENKVKSKIKSINLIFNFL